MMSARLLRPARERKHSRPGAWSARSFDALVHRYGLALDWVLDMPEVAQTAAITRESNLLTVRNRQLAAIGLLLKNIAVGWEVAT